ncbi:hypothetical protein ACQ4WX_39620 [Streptomyces lasalocidi]
MTWHSAAALDALPVARLHPLVRDTGRPALVPDLPALRNRPPPAEGRSRSRRGDRRPPRTRRAVGLAAARPRTLPEC